MVKYKQVYQKYLTGISLELWQKIAIFGLFFALSGVFGWVYEFIFYFFDGGMTTFFVQGGNFLPWINIYAFGSILIMITTRKVKKHPLWVFLISVVATGILEFVAGYLIFQLGNGTRYWDYNKEILNFGNIGGFVCLRSVLFFGISALFLVYVMVPVLIYLSKVVNKTVFITVAVILFSLVMIDEVYNLIARAYGLTDAITFYKSLGLKYVEK